MLDRPRRALPWLLATCSLPAWLVACSVDEVDLEGKACPCAGGFVCDTATNTCRSAGGSGGGSASGGAAGASSTGGSSTGGSSTGGSSTGGSNTGGGGTGGGNTGGATGAGITCGQSACPTSTQKCCHSSDGVSATGSCVASQVACEAPLVEMFCDEPSDCGAGKVCCERLSQNGNLTHIQCENQIDNCKPLGAGSATLLCNPTSPSCPTGKSCVLTSRGYSRCQ